MVKSIVPVHVVFFNWGKNFRAEKGFNVGVPSIDILSQLFLCSGYNADVAESVLYNFWLFNYDDRTVPSFHFEIGLHRFIVDTLNNNNVFWSCQQS